MTRIDYDKDTSKHYVRHKGWLEECKYRHKAVQKAIRAKRRSRPFTYFTFCASNAIDVFMLEQAGLLSRDKKTGRLGNVFFCEGEESEYEQIVNRIGSAEAGFFGDFKDFVLFRDTNDTRNKDKLNEGDDVPDLKVREAFRNKELCGRFRRLFPIDVINLDPYGVFFPPATGVYSPMLQAIERLFQWQNEIVSEEDGHSCESFTLMLTAYVRLEDFKMEAINDMHEIVLENIQEHQSFREVFETKFGSTDPKTVAKTDFVPYFATIFPKIIAPVARQFGWFGEHRHIYVYTSDERNVRDEGYHMMSSVVRYERLPNQRNLPRIETWPGDYEGRYVTEICNILKFKPVDVNLMMKQNAKVATQVADHLNGIVTFRERFLQSLE